MGRLSRGRAFYARTGRVLRYAVRGGGAMGGDAVDRGGKEYGRTVSAVMLSLFSASPLLSDRDLLLPAVPMLPLPRPSVRRFFSREPMFRPGPHLRQKADITAGYRICYRKGEQKVGGLCACLFIYIISVGRKAIGRRCAERRFAPAPSCSGTVPCYLCERGRTLQTVRPPFTLSVQ